MVLITTASSQLHWLHFLTTPINLNPKIVNPVNATVVFSGTQFLVALISGILMAFAFQLFLTNFSVAVGISNLGGDESESLGSTIRKVETKIGFWVLLTSSIALFIACFLAVKLSLVETAFLGAIIGVVVWSAYFSVLMWLGSSAVGSLIGVVVSTVSSGLQAATTAIGSNTAKKQAISTAEEITAAVRRELTSGFDPEGIKNSLQSSLSSLQLPKLDVQDIRNQFDLFLKDADLESIADSDLLKNINRQTFVDLINSLGNFSQKDANQIADELEAAWKQALNKKNPTEEVINLLQSATPEELKSEKLSQKLQQLVTSGAHGNKSNGSIMKQAVQYGLGAAGTAVLERLDLTEIDVEKVTSQLQKLGKNVKDVDFEKITEQLKQLASQSSQKATKHSSEGEEDDKSGQQLKNIKADVEDYIQTSFPWHFNDIAFKDEFREIIYDPYANPANVMQELEELDREFFVNLLTQREDISENRLKEIAEQLESERLEVLEIVRQAKVPEKTEDLRGQIENYLRSTGKEELNPEGIKRDLSKLLEDPEASFEDLNERFSAFDRDTFIQLLQQREDISSEEANDIANQLETTSNSVLNKVKEVQEEAAGKASELRRRVEEYLRNTNKDELNPEGIKRDFQVLLEDPQAGINVLRGRLSQFDRDTLVKLLSQREDLSEEKVNQVIDQLESIRDNILQAPEKVAAKAKEQYKQTTTSIADYLRNTNVEELNPEAILRDLSKVLENPQEGASALGERLSHVDRETLVKLLAQSGDLSEEKINLSIDRFQEAVTTITKTPGRLAKQATKKVTDFESTLEDYLRNTKKEELNPEGIKRDLQLLLQHPRSGVGNLGDRLSKFVRTTIVALLSQREDISEEEANQIVERIESVRNSIAEQFQQLQQKVQSVVDNIFGKIRNYLNSLNLPELNYEGIQQDFGKLFEDPQAGFDALRERLSQFDRETLVAVVSSREDISEEQANKIVSQIEKARDQVLHRTERIQEEVQKRLQSIKEQTQKQAEEAKNTVAGAAWWLFSTAFTSLAASVMAGIIAVRGFNFLN